MGIEDITAAINQAAEATDLHCDRSTMTYLDGGANELFRCYMRGGAIVEHTVPAGTSYAEIGRQVVERARSEK
jgi:hypothetical protein